jgi:predicted transcriptional regulator
MVDNATFDLDGGPLTLAGELGFALRAAEPGESDDPRDWAEARPMVLDVEGDVQRVEGAGVRAEYDPGLTQTAAAVSLVAVLGGLMAWFWPALKFAIAPLYTRIPTDAVLMHGARENIYRLIREEPGIHAHEVADRLQLGWGTTVYHLKLLERNHLIVSRHEGRYKRFFITGDQHLQHQDAVALLRNATSRSIAGAVAAQPGLIQKQVCQALGLSPSLASWHLQRLEGAGVVKAERQGRVVRYEPGPAWQALQVMAVGP